MEGMEWKARSAIHGPQPLVLDDPDVRGQSRRFGGGGSIRARTRRRKGFPNTSRSRCIALRRKTQNVRNIPVRWWPR